MIIGPKYKIARRLGARIFPKTQTTKFSISGSANKPRPKGRRRSRGGSEYGVQLIEKQKARFTYGLKNHQIANYVSAVRSRQGDPRTNLFQTLERRFDNVVFRLGLAPSRQAARQLVTHGHIMLNGRRLNVPSHQVKIGDVVTIRLQSQSSGITNELEERLKDYQAPAWLCFDDGKKAGEVIADPLASDMPSDINLTAILEFYSRV
ncbi:MAG: 30S ribosomal protein S4 [Patescibacteria group bacterium]|nr:30S ribosomal protein S4 [Patescibacteria group bacterium]